MSEFRVSFWIKEAGKPRESRSTITYAESPDEAVRNVLATIPLPPATLHKITTVSTRCEANRGTGANGRGLGQCHHYTNDPSGLCAKHRAVQFGTAIGARAIAHLSTDANTVGAEAAAGPRHVYVSFTEAEAEALQSEAQTAVDMAEANPGPYHAQHHAAKRAIAKLAAARG